MVNAVIITSSSATIQWSFLRLLEMRNEIISIFYGTTFEQLGVIIYPIPSDPNMEQYSIQLMSLQPGTRYNYQIYSCNEFANHTDGVKYEFKTDDSSEFSIVFISNIMHATIYHRIQCYYKFYFRLTRWFCSSPQLATPRLT